MKKLKYLILVLVSIYALYIICAKHRVDIMFINYTEDVYKITLFIDGSFTNEFYCAPQMIPLDLITSKLSVGKHSILVEFSNPQYTWSSEFWVVSNEYYQLYFRNNLETSDSLDIEFCRHLFIPLYQ